MAARVAPRVWEIDLGGDHHNGDTRGLKSVRNADVGGRLTDPGRELLMRARRVLHDLEEDDDAARGVNSLHGTICLALPELFGTRAVIP